LINDYLDLTHHTDLRSLTIWNLDHYDANVIEIAQRIIQRISSLRLPRIYLEFIAIGLGVDSWEWKKIADELNHPRFAELKDVSVNIKPFFGILDEDMDLIRKEMSCLDDPNIFTLLLRSRQGFARNTADLVTSYDAYSS
jgi:hypothetical protein